MFFEALKLTQKTLPIPRFKELHGLQDDHKIFEKHLTAGRYCERNFGPTKKNFEF